MKNVKKILIFAAISTFVFASAHRTAVLGGAGYWADDYSNVGAFPAAINDHNVAWTSGDNFTSIFDKDGTTWGFAGGTGDDVANVMWGNGTMGVRFGLSMKPDDDTTTNVDESNTGMDLGVGMPLADGDFGFTYASGCENCGGGTIGVNFRKAQSVWMWDNMMVNFSNTSDDGDTNADETAMDLDVAMYTNTDHGNGTNSLFGVQLNYGSSINASNETNSAVGLTWTFGVESAMTDWATLRVGYQHAYDFQDGGQDPAMHGISAGLGFNYGSFTLDMVLANVDAMLNDPVKYVTGRNGDGAGQTLGAGWTISYNW